MMTKEEVAEIMHYCKTHGMSYKSRLDELGIPTWRFYDSKSKYATEELNGDSAGSFLQLANSSEFVPMPSFVNNTSKKRKCKGVDSFPKNLSIELRTPSGVMMRISGEFDKEMLQSVIQAANGHV